MRSKAQNLQHARNIAKLYSKQLVKKTPISYFELIYAEIIHGISLNISQNDYSECLKILYLTHTEYPNIHKPLTALKARPQITPCGPQ